MLMVFSGISSKELNNAFSKYSPEYKGRKEDYFAFLYLMQEFSILPTQAGVQTSFYGNDYGIDAYHYDGQSTKNLYLIQCKWTDDHLQFKESFKRLVYEGLERVFGNLQTDQSENPMLNRLRSCVYENKNVIDQVWFRFVYNGDEMEAENSKLLQDYRETLESKKYVLEDFFGRSIIFHRPQYISNKTRRISSPAATPALHTYEIPDGGAISIQRPDGSAKMIIRLISLRTLLEMYQALDERLFERNIRSSYGFSQSQSMVNAKLKKSLRLCVIDNTQSIEDFSFFHNGVTIKTVKIDQSDGKLVLFEPRVLNGAQTISSVSKFFDEHKAKKDILDRLEDVLIPAKIIVSSNEAFVKTVAINNNRQNPIEPWHLRANEEEQLELAERFAKIGIYYENRENSFKNEKVKNLMEQGIVEDRPIKFRLFGQMLLGIQGEVSRMSNMGDAFENDTQYHDMFRQKYLTSNLHELVLFYKINYPLTGALYAIEAMGEVKYSYAHRTKYLAWALLIQALLNDPNFQNSVEDYGTHMTNEQAYGDFIRKIATTKIRPIFATAFSKKSYASAIKEEKFGFLRRKETYNDCMKVAKKLYRWQRKNV